MERITVDERRARLARRQALAPGCHAADPVEAADRVVCLHATDPSTVHLSAWARTPGVRIEDVERAIYGDRTLVKHLSMRRTLFVFPRATLPDAQAGASRRVADRERRRLVADVERAELHPDGATWLATAEAAVLAALADGREATASELRGELPVLEGAITYGEGRSWGGDVPVGPRVMTVLSASGSIVRGTNEGRWNVSRPRWSSMSAWLGEPLAEVDTDDGVAAMVARWLRAFGPGTERDVTWWLGSTKTAVRAALRTIGAIEVDLDGAVGYVLPDDLDPTDPVEPWGALLPVLDPTTMGWADRDWYLGPHKADLFDSTGNAGSTAWWDGRIVGGWRQREGGEIELQLLEDVGRDATAELEEQAGRLGGWLGGVRVMPRFPSPLWKRLDPG